ncbi:MAG: hypothetical protein ABW034_05980 [Steroidobacteraceae bacterium]
MPAHKHSIRAERGAAADLAKFAPPNASIDLIVLSTDHALLAVMQAAGEGEPLFWSAATAEAVVEHLVSGRCGILLVDLERLRGEVAVLLTRLAAQFPSLVLMAAGRREDESAVAQLLTRGVIYRYIHKPISPGRAQQFLQAASRRHRQLNQREPMGLATVRELVRARVWQQLFKYSVRAVGVMGGVAAGAFVLSSLREDVPSEPEIAVQTPQLRPPVAAAEFHAAPPSLAQPKSTAAERGSPDALDQLLQDTQRMVDAGRLNDAMRTVRQAASVAADDARIAILATTIGEQLLTRASAAVGEGQFDLAQRRLDAAVGLDRELNLGLPDLQAGVDALEHARATAAAKQLESILDVARARREAGQLIEPAGASAFDQLQVARVRSPEAEIVSTETQALALACIAAAEQAIADHRFDDATRLLDRVDELVPAMSAARKLRTEIELMRGTATETPAQ